MVISEELELCPLTPVFQLHVERVREVAQQYVAAHEALLSGAGKATVEDQMPVEELEEMLDALDLPEETHVEFLARFGLKPSERGQNMPQAMMPSLSEQSGYKLKH